MLYSAAKATTESLIESYATLLEPFGIRTMIVEPGGFRTPFAGNNSKSDGGISADYEPTIQAWIDVLDAASRDEKILKGDPVIFGERVLRPLKTKVYLRVFAQNMIRAKL